MTAETRLRQKLEQVSHNNFSSECGKDVVKVFEDTQFDLTTALYVIASLLDDLGFRGGK